MQISIKGQGNVNVGGRFFVINGAMSQISTHPFVWVHSKVQRPWALFHETMVIDMQSCSIVPALTGRQIHPIVGRCMYLCNYSGKVRKQMNCLVPGLIVPPQVSKVVKTTAKEPAKQNANSSLVNGRIVTLALSESMLILC